MKERSPSTLKRAKTATKRYNKIMCISLLSFPNKCKKVFSFIFLVYFFLFSKKKLSYKRLTNNYTRLKNSERRPIKTWATSDKILTLRRSSKASCVFAFVVA